MYTGVDHGSTDKERESRAFFCFCFCPTDMADITIQKHTKAPTLLTTCVNKGSPALRLCAQCTCGSNTSLQSPRSKLSKLSRHFRHIHVILSRPLLICIDYRMDENVGASVLGQAGRLSPHAPTLYPSLPHPTLPCFASPLFIVLLRAMIMYTP